MSNEAVIVRAARLDDVDAILAIVNYNIIYSDALWNNTEQTRAQRLAWLEQQSRCAHPVFVATRGEDVLAYGSYGPFRPHEGYAHTVEHSIYVMPQLARRGIGSMLLDALMTHATETGKHMMIGAVTDSNTASIQLHKKKGFIAMPAIPEIGRKFDRWLNLVFMYRILNP